VDKSGREKSGVVTRDRETYGRGTQRESGTVSHTGLRTKSSHAKGTGVDCRVKTQTSVLGAKARLRARPPQRKVVSLGRKEGTTGKNIKESNTKK